MGICSYFMSHRPELSRKRACAWLLTLALPGLAAHSAVAETYDGREIPVWSNSSIVLPDVAFDGELYNVELQLAAAAPLILRVSSLRAAAPTAAQDNPYDNAARFDDGVLTVPVFESAGRYYAAELVPVPSLTTTAPQFLLTNIWEVQPGKLAVPVSGLDYVSGTKSDVTDSQGRFYAVAGQSVSFSIGALELGVPLTGVPSSATSYAALFPQGEKDASYLPSLRVLSLLDADNNSVNGIQITDAMKQSAALALIGMSLSSWS